MASIAFNKGEEWFMKLGKLFMSAALGRGNDIVKKRTPAVRRRGNREKDGKIS